jgi:DHA1 family multidrug resistance protein-like MFS transporter
VIAHTPPGTAAERRTTLQLIVVCVASFVTWAGFGAILPYLPIFLRDDAHSPMWLIGVIAAAYYAGTFAFSAPLGRLSDSLGRKPIIVSGVWLYAMATLLFTTTTDANWFTLFRLLEGVGAAAVGPASQAFIADISPDERRSRAYGWLTTAQFGGLVLGPALAPPLYALGGGHGRWAFYTIFLFGSALSALTALALMVTIKEPAATARRRTEKLVRPPLRQLIAGPVAVFILLAVTSSFAMGSFEVLWSLWLQHLGASLTYISSTWIVFSLPMLLSFVGGALADRGNRFLLLVSGYTVSAGAWVIYGTTSNLWLFIIVNALEGLSVAWSYPAKQAFLVQVSPPPWIGAVQGLENSAGQLAALLGTLVSPLLYSLIGGFTISLGGLISLLGLAVATPILQRTWALIRRGNSAPETAPLRR